MAWAAMSPWTTRQCDLRSCYRQLAVCREQCCRLCGAEAGSRPIIRSTFMAGYQHAYYSDDILLPGLAHRAAYAGYLSWSPVKPLDLGVEYRHAEHDVVSDLKGQMNREGMAAKSNVRFYAISQASDGPSD